MSFWITASAIFGKEAGERLVCRMDNTPSGLLGTRLLLAITIPELKCFQDFFLQPNPSNMEVTTAVQSCTVNSAAALEGVGFRKLLDDLVSFPVSVWLLFSLKDRAPLEQHHAAHRAAKSVCSNV